MNAVVSQTTGISIVNSTVCLGTDRRNHQSSASLAFVGGIHRWAVNSRTKASNAENDSIWWRHHALATRPLTTRRWITSTQKPGEGLSTAAPGYSWSIYICWKYTPWYDHYFKFFFYFHIYSLSCASFNCHWPNSPYVHEESESSLAQIITYRLLGAMQLSKLIQISIIKTQGITRDRNSVKVQMF